MEELIRMLLPDGIAHPHIARPSETEWFLYRYGLDDNADFSEFDLQSHYHCLRKLMTHRGEEEGQLYRKALLTEWKRYPRTIDTAFLLDRRIDRDLIHHDYDLWRRHAEHQIRICSKIRFLVDEQGVAISARY